MTKAIVFMRLKPRIRVELLFNFSHPPSIHSISSDQFSTKSDRYEVIRISVAVSVHSTFFLGKKDICQIEINEFHKNAKQFKLFLYHARYDISLVIIKIRTGLFLIGLC